MLVRNTDRIITFLGDYVEKKIRYLFVDNIRSTNQEAKSANEVIERFSELPCVEVSVEETEIGTFITVYHVDIDKLHNNFDNPYWLEGLFEYGGFVDLEALLVQLIVVAM